VPQVYDISVPVAPGTWVWPGDRPYERAWTWRIADGATCNVGQIALSCHTGTHIDAPYHFAENGATIEAIPLEACVGPAVVLPLARLAGTSAERVLVRAGGAAPTPAAIEQLRHLRLFGIDGPSVDPPESRMLDVHHALWRRRAVILEGLDLSAVPDGEYQLVALPLKLVGMDAAPVRAVLIGA
jgi:arylformamidase